MNTSSCAPGKDKTAVFRITVLLFAAMPLFPQPSCSQFKAPWLQGEPEGTEQLLRNAMQIGRLQSFALRCASEFETERGNYPQARLLLTRAKELENSRELLNYREAKLRSALGDFAGAERAALDGHHWDGREIKKLKVSNPVSLNAMGEAYAARGQHEQALAILEKSLSVSRKESISNWVEAKVLTVFVRLALNDRQAALADAEKAVSVAQKRWGARGPRTLDAVAALGVALQAAGRMEEAERWITLALQSRTILYRNHPKTAASFLHAARFLALQKGLRQRSHLD